MLATLMLVGLWLLATALLILFVGGGTRLRSGADPIRPVQSARQERDAA